MTELLLEPGEVTIGGKTYSLVYDLAAVILFHKTTGLSLLQEGIFPQINPANNPELFARCLWAGLQRKQPEFAFEKVCEAVGFSPEIPIIVEQMTQAIFAHFPKAKASPNGEAPAEEKPLAHLETQPPKVSAPFVVSPSSISDLATSNS